MRPELMQCRLARWSWQLAMGGPQTCAVLRPVRADYCPVLVEHFHFMPRPAHICVCCATGHGRCGRFPLNSNARVGPPECVSGLLPGTSNQQAARQRLTLAVGCDAVAAVMYTGRNLEACPANTPFGVWLLVDRHHRWTEFQLCSTLRAGTLCCNTTDHLATVEPRIFVLCALAAQHTLPRRTGLCIQQR